MKKINIFLEQQIEKILYFFLFLQPAIDLLTSLSINVLHIDLTFGVIVRMLFLLFIGYYYLFVMKSKKRYLGYLIAIICYMASFILMIYFIKGSSALIYEVKNMLRAFYFPLILIMLFEIFRNKKRPFSSIDFIKVMSIYLLLIIIPTLTGTSFNGYTQGKSGIIGWFQSINEISAIFVGIMPFLFIFLLKEKRKYINILLILSFLFVLFNLGSKIVIGTLAITIFVYFITYLYKTERKDMKKILISTCLLVVIFISSLIVLLPKTNFYKNIKLHLDFLGVENITDVVTKKELIDRFIFSDRLTYLNNTRSNYQKSSVVEQFIGLGYIENYSTDEVSCKMIEMDIFDILYRHGLIGFIIYFLPVIIFIKKAYISLFTTLDKRNCYEKVAYLLAISLLLITSVVAGHVLLSPAVSIYLTLFIINSIKFATTRGENTI